MGFSSFISEVLYFVAVFPHSVRRRELNRVNIKIMLVLFFGFLITNLPCHVMTLQIPARMI